MFLHLVLQGEPNYILLVYQLLPHFVYVNVGLNTVC